VFANEEILARRWPAFHDLLVTHTPLRSVLALSLPGRLQAVGAMDLYSADPDGVTTVDVYEARCVAQLVSDHLDVAADWSVWTPTERPTWSDTPDAQRRGRLRVLGVEHPAGGVQAEQAGHADEPLGLGAAVEGQVGPGGQAGDAGAPVHAVLAAALLDPQAGGLAGHGVCSVRSVGKDRPHRRELSALRSRPVTAPICPPDEGGSGVGCRRQRCRNARRPWSAN
jgi:hypothetical protein